ncbi:MAG TPA: helix-turn-helix domain-containing protein [Acetobacteraceae bacterium]|nr:helix-turn-helix domain-containing protein [Acetobacteraceae bacterium]
MAVLEMSERELSRRRVMIDLADGRLTVEAAGALMGVGRRQVFRVCRAFASAGASGLVSRKHGRPSNRRRGAAFGSTTLALVRDHYADFGPMFAAEKLAVRHGLRVGVETLRQ